MARHGKEDMAWKPRRLRKQDIEARVSHLQKTLPPVVREVFRVEESAAKKELPDRASKAEPAPPQKKSKFAVLLWEPRGDGRTDK